MLELKKTPEHTIDRVFLLALLALFAALSETVNDTIYTTYIYCYDGYLREITVSDGTTVLPGDGQKIIETNALAIDMVSSNLYCFTITDTTGYTYPLYISLNAKQS